MPPPDASDVDAALIAVLRADPTLTQLAPDGVWYQQADAGKKQFVIVSLADHRDVGQFGPAQHRTAYEDALYLVKSVELMSTTNNSKAAAARIHALLEDATLIVAGYTCMTVHRESRARFIEKDQVDPSIKWAHRGGNYRVQMAPDAV